MKTTLKKIELNIYIMYINHFLGIYFMLSYSDFIIISFNIFIITSVRDIQK